ncbi:MAG TPA: OmpA family protein [Thermoanaerobaculaceae bacterium]|nr:OmpA family protein [Thermoanaerobaculaceae bacterium]
MVPTYVSLQRSGVAGRSSFLLLSLAAAVVLAGCASGGRVATPQAVPNDPELGKGLDQLARAYETLDVNRIMPLYAAGDYALSWDTQMKFATGAAEHRNILTTMLGDVKDFKVTMDPNFEAWRDGTRAWTSRKFKAVGTRKNGEKIEYSGWHSAIWDQKDGRWQIWYEHFGGSPQRAQVASPPPPPPPAPVATPTPPPAAVALPFGDVFFDFDKWAIRKDQIAALDVDVDLLKKNPDVRVLIEGHCDERGGETYNLGLGERRATAVQKYLLAKGVEPERVATVSYGKRKPFESGTGEQVWSKNRRAHFVQLQK